MSRLFGASLLVAWITVRILSAQNLQFEVASLKPHLPGTASTSAQDLPTGQIILNGLPMRLLVLMAYPVDTMPAEIVGLPDWADKDAWDLNARGKPGATADERRQMFRALLEERAGLAAHYEHRQTSSYDLVRVRPDSLGPQLKPSTLDCSKPDAPVSRFPPPGPELDAVAMSRCNLLIAGDTMYSGGAPLSMLIRFITGPAGRTIVDKTGLEGRFAFQLSFQRRPQAGPDADPLPSVFTAVQEQLGLKLQPSTTQAQILVIERLQRPVEN